MPPNPHGPARTVRRIHEAARVRPRVETGARVGKGAASPIGGDAAGVFSPASPRFIPSQPNLLQPLHRGANRFAASSAIVRRGRPKLQAPAARTIPMPQALRRRLIGQGAAIETIVRNLFALPSEHRRLLPPLPVPGSRITLFPPIAPTIDGLQPWNVWSVPERAVQSGDVRIGPDRERPAPRPVRRPIGPRIELHTAPLNRRLAEIVFATISGQDRGPLSALLGCEVGTSFALALAVLAATDQTLRAIENPSVQCLSRLEDLTPARLVRYGVAPSYSAPLLYHRGLSRVRPSRTLPGA